MSPTITNDIKKAARVLREGRLVAVPTGTSYGLAADALQGWALQRLRNLKQRPATRLPGTSEKSFTVFLDESLLDAYFDVSAEERTFLLQHTNQPLTVLLPVKPGLAHLAVNGRVGLRVIDHPLLRQLAAAYRAPLTATSANISGQEPARTPAAVAAAFPGRLDETTYDLSLGCILDGGPLAASLPSTIVKLSAGQPEIIRPGAWLPSSPPVPLP